MPNVGDWCAPSGGLNKSGCGGHGTCGGSYEYISALRTVKSWASATGNSADAAKYSALERKVVSDFTASYLRGPDNNVQAVQAGFNCPSTTVQTANALGLAVDPQAAGALDALIKDIAAKGTHLDTGIVGTKYLLESLSQGGRADLALAVVTNPT